jgi:NDP-sugar pyrophosphorylase family protein
VSNQTKGILLAGAHPWTNSGFDLLAPRSLAPIAHRPLIWYALSWLDSHGIREVAVCGNRETRALQSRLAGHVPEKMTAVYHEDAMPRGAAGSTRDAALATDADTFVVADATSVPSLDLRDLLRAHRTSGASVTVAVHAERRSNGNPALHVPSGIYVFDRAAFEHVPPVGFFDIKEHLIPRLYAAGTAVVPYESDAPTPRVLDASTYMSVNEWMVEHLIDRGQEHGGYARRGRSLVHREAFIAADAALEGAVLVAPGARVLSGAVVIGPASIGRDSTISNGVLVSRSAVWRRSVIGEHSVVDRCIIGDDAIVEPGRRTVGGVVTVERRSTAKIDHVRPHPASLGRPADVGARLGRLVFGASWSRPTATP